MSPTTGAVLQGRYELRRLLGRGGLGIVHVAWDRQLEREVAVKTIAEPFVEDSAARRDSEARLIREARLAARIAHPNVAAVHDLGTTDEGVFLVMELVPGASLATLFARLGYPEPRSALEVAAAIAAGLAAAHALDVVHRDVKPANVLVSRRGEVKVVDFGIAKALVGGEALTRTSLFVGSPAYMAPEQVTGELPSPATDVYALGLVLLEMLSGAPPRAAGSVAELVRFVLDADPLAGAPLLDDQIPAGAWELLAAALAKPTATRLSDAREFADRCLALARCLPVEPESWLTRARAASTEVGVAAGLAATPTPEIHTAPTAVTPTVATARRPAGAPVVLAPRLAAIPVSTEGRKGWAKGVGAALGGAVAVLGIGWIALVTRRAPPPGPSESRPVAEQPGASATSAAGSALPPVEGTAAPSTLGGGAVPAVVPGQRRLQAQARSPAASTEGGAARPTAVEARRAPVPPPPTESPPIAAAPPVVPASPWADRPIALTVACRRAAEFDVDPEDAEVAIDGVVLGIADDWDGIGGGKAYRFPGPGRYVARLALDGYRTAYVAIEVGAAGPETVEIELDLEEKEEP